MSYHQIEDIIEDCICLVDKAELSKWGKRELIYNLYQLHDRFDTSYTRFRVLRILQDNCYLYSIPISDHPDYPKYKEYFNQLDEHSQEWIPAHIDNELEGSVFLKEQKIWFEVNDVFWKRIQCRLPKEEQEPPQEINSIQLFLSLLQISLHQGDFLFAKRWYALFANSILQFDLDEKDGIPKKFDLWLCNDDLLKIRKIIEENQHILSLRDKPYKKDEYLTVPKLQSKLESVTNPDEKAVLEFLLDFNTPIETIGKKNAEEIENLHDFSKYELIYEFFRGKLDSQWQDGIKEMGKDEVIITFLRKNECKKTNSEKFYKCIILECYPDVNQIALRMGIQNTQILSWQNRKASSKPEHQHFIENLFLYTLEKAPLPDSINILWGAWDYNTKRTKKTLIRRLESLWSIYAEYESIIMNFHCLSLSQWIPLDSSKKLMKAREKLISKRIIFIQYYLDFMLLIACLNLKNGHHKTAKKLIKEIEDLLAQRVVTGKLKQRVRQGLSYLDTGEGVYPELSTIYSDRLNDE